MRSRFALATALFAVALATRLPFQTQHLFAWDSVLYARAVEDFDPAAQRPQPPGYLGYVLLIRALDAVAHDPNRAMTLVSAFAGAAAVALLYLLGARLYDERTGRVAAALLLTAVTFWAYGGVAYPYTLLAALTTGLALLFWRALDAPRALPFLGASAAWGLAVGFRPDLAVFIAPLWLLAASRQRLGVVAGGAAAAGTLGGAWFLATAWQADGLEPFLAALGEQSAYVERTTAVTGRGPGALLTNGRDLARFLGRGLYALAVPLAIALAVPRTLGGAPRRLAFLALWVATPLALYLLVHVGDYGYVFSVLPGLAILAARGTLALAASALVPARALWRIGFLVVAANAAIFLFTETPLSAADLQQRDRGIAEKTAYVRALGAPGVLVVSVYDAVLVEHYLRDVPYRLLRRDPYDAPFELAVSGCATSPCVVVAWDDLLDVDGSAWETVALPSRARLRVARPTADARLSIERLSVRLTTDADKGPRP